MELKEINKKMHSLFSEELWVTKKVMTLTRGETLAEVRATSDRNEARRAPLLTNISIHQNVLLSENPPCPLQSVEHRLLTLEFAF